MTLGRYIISITSLYVFLETLILSPNLLERMFHRLGRELKTGTAFKLDLLTEHYRFDFLIQASVFQTTLKCPFDVVTSQSEAEKF